MENNTETIANDASVETLLAENSALQTALRERDTRDVAVDALRTAGARSPTLIFDLIKSRVTYDESSRPQNIDVLIKTLRHTNPEQFGRDAAAVDASAGTTQQSEPLTREMLAKMSPDEIRRMDWQTVRQILNS